MSDRISQDNLIETFLLRRKDGDNMNVPLIKFHLKQSDICAITEEEFLSKSQENLIDLLGDTSSIELDEKINSDLNLTNWRDHVRVGDNSLFNFNIEFYSNYKELLSESWFYSDNSKRAFSKEAGRLHRSYARISLILSITAAEDYVNYLWAITEQPSDVKKQSLMNKWKVFIPNLESEFPFFIEGYKIRNNSIIHHKTKSSLDLKHILDLNYLNAIKLKDTVREMIEKCENEINDISIENQQTDQVNMLANYTMNNISMFASIIEEINKFDRSKKE